MAINPVEHPVLEAIANRWSPYRFLPREVEDEKLLQCLEAARWAASSFNDQPWFFLLARRQEQDAFSRMITCLLEPNRPWAANAGALILTVTRSTFEYNGKPNRVALHDLGQAAAHLALQAATLGLQAHQMAGVNLSLVRQQYGVPDGFEPQTAIALGYPDPNPPEGEAAQALQQREIGSRRRRPIDQHTFSGSWGNSAEFSDK